MAFSDDMKELAVDLTSEFSEGATCTILHGDRSYDTESGNVDTAPNNVVVPLCIVKGSKGFYKKEDFEQASIVITVAGNNLSGVEVQVGHKINIDDEDHEICAISFDMYGALFTVGLR